MQDNACFAAIGRVRACSFSTSGFSRTNWCGRQNRQQRPLDRCLRSCTPQWGEAAAALVGELPTGPAMLHHYAMLCYSGACFPPYACLNALATPTHVFALSPFMSVFYSFGWNSTNEKASLLKFKQDLLIPENYIFPVRSVFANWYACSFLNTVHDPLSSDGDAPKKGFPFLAHCTHPFQSLMISSPSVLLYPRFICPLSLQHVS